MTGFADREQTMEESSWNDPASAVRISGNIRTFISDSKARIHEIAREMKWDKLMESSLKIFANDHIKVSLFFISTLRLKSSIF